MKHSSFVRSMFMINGLFFGMLVSAWSMPPQAATQGHGNGKNNPNDPLKSGYVVVTPTTSEPGLAVFETFGQSRGNDFTQAGVLPSELVTEAIMYVSESNRLSRNLGIAFTNPTSSEASIFLTLRDEQGSDIAAASLTLAGHHQTAQFVTQLFSGHPSLLHDVTGTIDIVSNIPIAVVGLRFRGANFSTLPVTRLSIPAALPLISADIGGPDAVILPQFAAGGGWASEIVIANTGTSSLTVRVDLFGPDGLPLVTDLNGQSGSSFKNITIPGHGVFTLSPKDSNGDSNF